MTLRAVQNRLASFPSTEKMPLLFLGHGTPMNAIETNDWTRAWSQLGRDLPRPAAMLCVSAHWLTEGPYVHVAEKPKTLHDFYGFPPELYAQRYACDGAPQFAAETQTLVPDTKPDQEWGLDHGAWSVLKHLYPQANVPVFQVSLDVHKTDRAHFDLGRALAPLRHHGVLILGSGNIVHNLGRALFDEHAPAFDWAREFDTLAGKKIDGGDYESLIDYRALGHAAQLSVPTPDHYWPLLTVLGAADRDETATFPTSGLTMGSISMRAVQIQ